MASDLTISAIMPAYNAARFLPRVLPPLVRMAKAGEIAEVLVVDDQSSDDTANLAAEMGAKVVETLANGGPGVARNLAAKTAVGDVLWFVDSDVIAWPGGPEHIKVAFADDNVGAVFGSYDEAPEGHWFSRYKNLLHRFHHQRAQETSAFWAGCGAVRAKTFAEMGGFDVTTYRVPSIEDIELGYRIRAAGMLIRVVPELQGKHLKIWSMRNAIFTDIYRRALPWSRLLIAREGLSDELNIGSGERARAVIALVFWLSLVAALSGFGGWLWAVLFAGAALIGNWRLTRYFYLHGGVGFALAAMAYHQLYYLYSTASYGWCLFEYHVLGKRNRLHVP